MMKATESLEEFYRHKFIALSENSIHETGQFNIFRIQDLVRLATSSPTYIRRDFYKIMLFQGNNIFHYSDKSIEVTGNTLLFFNPQVPYTYEAVTPGTTGYFCVFRDEFFRQNLRLNLGDLPLFAPGTQPVFHLSDKENKLVQVIFEKIERELNTSYIHKYELIKSYISELIYLTMKLNPSEETIPHPDAGSRLTSVLWNY